MVKKKIQRYIAIGLAAATLICGLGFSATKSYKTHKEAKEFPIQMIINESNDKLLLKQTIIDDIKEISNLEILQMSMRKSVRFKQGDLFKKSQDLTFIGVGKYYLDLSSITADNIVVNSESKIVTLYCKLPQCEVTFLEDKTEYSEVEKGFLTLGDIKISPESMENAKVQVKNQMLEDMKKEENISEATDRAAGVIQNTLNLLTQDGYKVSINFIR